MDTTYLLNLGGAEVNNKKCSDNLQNVRKKRSLNNIQYSASSESLPQEYMPSWYVPSIKRDFEWDIEEKNKYYRSIGFPTIICQTEYTGINPFQSNVLVYDNSLCWGEELFPVANCVSCSVSCAMQIFNFLKTGDKDTFSVLWLHGNHSGEGTNSSIKKGGGKGAIAEEVFDKLINDGAVRYSIIHPYMSKYNQMQYDTIEPGAPQDVGTARQFVLDHYSELLPKAQHYRISSWNVLDKYDTETIKSTIINLGCVLIRIKVSNDLQNDDEAKIVDETNGRIEDRYSHNGEHHLMCVIGWKMFDGVLHWTCVNSWGNWGYKERLEGESDEDYKKKDRSGLCYIPYNYSKITHVWKLVPNINPNFNWDYPKVKGQPVFITHKELNRLQDRIKYKCEKKNIYIYSPFVKKGMTFSAYYYNKWTDYMHRLNNNINIPELEANKTYLSQQMFDDLVDAINTI